jgi:acyl-[acyl-carrier-protein]-phospholipid O-acyltransferase/long-chain-fatty-acid--[acyl-carrier-protein] ligase
VEGYGATELSPVVSGNVPPSRAAGGQHGGVKEGSVGRPLPGVSVKIVDLETGANLGPNRSGMLLVTGPNVMKGYYGRPDLTAEVIRQGWYVTGDVATVDEEGFITITGRINRFSKLAGEMVPHIRVEEAICQVLRLSEDDLKVVVTSVPDRKKGERLVVLYTELGQSPEQICRALAASGLPPLWIPSPESFRRVHAIPVLGTGKLDLKQLKDVALAEFTNL